MITETIKELISKRAAALILVDKYTDAITALQNACDHKTEDGKDAFGLISNTPNFKLYICLICSKEEKV